MQTNEEATVYVNDLVFFVKVQILDTPADLSLGKLCEDHGYSYEWTTGQKRTSCKKTTGNFIATRRKYSNHTKSEYAQSSIVEPVARFSRNQKQK